MGLAKNREQKPFTTEAQRHSFKWMFWAAGVLFLAAGWAAAGNSGLASLQRVPAGERVANYLQAYLTTIGTIVESENSGGILEGARTYRVVAAYDPDQEAMEITLIGMQRDPATLREMLGVVRKIILKLNPKLRKNFGVTLGEGDFRMTYLYAKSGQVLMRYPEGDAPQGAPPVKASPTASSGQRPKD